MIWGYILKPTTYPGRKPSQNFGWGATFFLPCQNWKEWRHFHPSMETLKKSFYSDIWLFPKMVGFPNKPMGFLLKMIILGCFGGTTILGNPHIWTSTVSLLTFYPASPEYSKSTLQVKPTTKIVVPWICWWNEHKQWSLQVKIIESLLFDSDFKGTYIYQLIRSMTLCFP